MAASGVEEVEHAKFLHFSPVLTVGCESYVRAIVRQCPLTQQGGSALKYDVVGFHDLSGHSRRGDNYGGFCAQT